MNNINIHIHTRSLFQYHILATISLRIDLNCDADYALKYIPVTWTIIWRKWQLNNSNIKWQLSDINFSVIV